MGHEIFFWICLVMVFKSLTIGSDFNIVSWLIHGRHYSSWYFARETWDERLKRDEE